MNSPLRILSLWLIFVLGAAFLAELGCATGTIPGEVLDNLANHSAGWWQQPRWLHGVHSLLLALLLMWTSMLLLLPGGSRHIVWAGGLGAVLLSSHFSPFYRGVPYISIGGVLLALGLVRWLFFKTKRNSDPRIFLRAVRNAGRTDTILWSLTALIVLYTFVNQFGEASRVVSRQTDFGTFYDAAVTVGGHGDPYRATEGAYLYPPSFAFYFGVMTWWPRAGASLLWFTFKLALVIWSLIAVYDVLREGSSTGIGRRVLAVGIVVVAARFLLDDLQYGNVNAFVLWLVLAAIVLDLRGKSAPAGLALGAAIAVKIVPVVFLVYFLSRGRYRVVLWTVASALGLVLAPLLFSAGSYGETWNAYRAVGDYGVLGRRMAQPDNQSLWGVLNRSLGLPLSRVIILWIGCSVALTAVAARIAWKVRHEPPVHQAGAASLFFLLGLLVSPGSWVVHYGAVLFPMSYLFRAGVMGRPRSYGWWVVFIVANLVFTFSGWWRPTVRWSVEQAWFVAVTCLLFFTLVFLVSKTPAKTAESPDLRLENAV